MSITVKCSGCGNNYHLRDELAGKRVKCKCGASILVPPPIENESDDSVYRLAPEDPTPLRSLVEEELDAMAAAPPARPQPVHDTATPAEEEGREPVRRARKKLPPSLAKLLALAGTLGFLLVGAGVVYLVIAWIQRPGYPTPEQAYQAYQQALLKKDWATQVRTLDPDSRDQVVELAARMAAYTAKSSPAVGEVFRKHGASLPTRDEPDSTGVPYRPASSPVSPPSSLAANVSNKPAFYAELLDAVEADQEKHLPNNPVLKLMAKKAQKAVIKLHASAELTDVRMDGEQAEGVIIYSIDDEEIEAPIAFKRLRGRWFLHVPDPADFGGMAGSPFAGIPLE